MNSFAQVSYSQNWTATGLNSWTTAGSGVAAARITTAAQICGTGGTIRTEQYYGTSGQFISPSLGTSNGGLITVSYSFKATQFGAATTAQTLANLGTVALEYGSSASGPWTVAQTINSSNHTASASCATKTATFTPPIGALYIRFNVTSASGADTYYYFDDVAVSQGAAPTCFLPTALTTSSLTSTGVTLGWTAPSPAPSNGYQYEVRTSGAAGSGATGLVTSGSTASGVTSAAVSGLTANTSYSYYVRGFCGGTDYSAWSGAGTFYTGYCQVTGGSSSTSYYLNSIAVSGAQANFSNTASTYTAYVNNSATSCSQYPGGTFGLSLAASGGSTYYYYCWIDWNNDLDFADAGETMVATTSYAATYSSTTLAVPSGQALGSYRMRVATSYSGAIGSCGSAPYGNYVDYTFNVVALPTCFIPTTLTSSAITTNSASISWTAPTSGTPASYDYYISTTNTAPTVSTTPTGSVTAPTTTASLSGLTASTTYYFWVRTSCSVSDQSGWAGSGTFVTLTPGQLGAGTGTTSYLPVYSCYGYSYSQQIYLASELNNALTPGSTYITKIRFKPTTVSSLTQTNFNNWTVYMGNTSKSSFASTTDWVASTAMSQVYSSTLVTMADGVWVELTLSTPFQWDGTSNLVVSVDENAASYSCTAAWASYPAGAVRGILYYNDTTNPDPTAPPTAVSTYTDIPQMQVVAIPTPTCFFPTALTATAVTNNSATLGWTAPSSGSPASYDYYVSTSNTAPTGSTTPTGSVTAPTTSVALSGLLANTNYYYWVRTYCSVSDQSGWAGAGTFKTTCDISSVPYNEGFEGITLAGDTPACMSASPAITAAGKIRTYIAAATGTNSALTPRTGTKFGSVYYSPNAKGTFISAPIALTAGVSYTASAYYITDGVAWPTVGIYYGTTATEAGMTNTIATVSSAAATTYTKISGAFTPTTTGVYYIGFQADNTTTNAPNYCTFDDLSVIVTPTTVTSFSGPATVCSQGGDTITITGAGFPGATSVQFNGVEAASFTVVDGSTITAVTPSGVSTGYITVVSPQGTGTSSTQLTVTPNPVVAAITGGNVSTCYPDTVQLNDTTPSGTWSSSDNDIATVDGSGLVTPLTPGTVTISYTVPNGACLTTVTTSITVNMPVAISGSTSSQTVVTGNNAAFSVTATGTGLTYQWQVSTDDGASFSPLTDSTPYSGTNTNTLTITNTPDTYNGYQYMCTVSGTSPCASLDSTPGLLNVGNTGIIGDPAPVPLCDSGSGTATFTVVATGTVDSYSWEENQGLGWNPLTDTTVGGVTYSGTSTDTLSLSGLTLTNNGWSYRAVVTGPANSATSNPALLSVNQGVSFTGNPSNQTVCYTGGSTTFTAAASGSFSAYQWQYSANGTSWAPVANGTPVGATYSGAATGTLAVTTTAATPVAGTYYYKAVALAAAPCSNVSSTTAQLLINNPTITTGPSATTVVAGNTATFSVVDSAASPSYQWQRATALAGPYTDVVDLTPATVTYTGATTATLSVITTSGTAASTANFYRCVVTSGTSCLVTSSGAQLTITTYCQPATTTGGTTDSITNAVITNVTTATNITQASGAASPWYTFYNNTPLDVTQGQNMSVAMTFGTDSTQYSAVWIDYNRDGVFSATENVALATAAAAGGTTVTYNFTVPFTATPGVTRIRLRGASDSAYTAGGACTSSSYGETEDYLLNIIVAPACSGAPVAGTATSSVANVCYTGTANLAVTGYSTGVTGISLQWYNSAGAISGATSATYTTPVLSASETYFCRVTCANGGAFTDTNTLTIGVDAPSVTGTTPNTRCGTGSVALAATGSAGTTLGWYAAATGGAPLGTGTTFNTPSIAATTTYYVQANVGGGTESGGKPSTTGASGSYVGTATGIVFNATSQFNLNSAVVYPTGTGTMTVALYNSSGTELASTSAIPVTGTGLATPVTLPLNFTVPVGTGYRLLLKAYTGITGLLRDSSGNTYPYNSTNSSVTGGYISGTSTSYYFFYNLGISTGCSSARTAVTATVTAPPALSISSASSTICNGLSTTTPVTVTSTLGDYDTYTWSPSAGVSGSAASGYTFNPTATTTYTLTATSASGCANTATHTVTVNALPSVFAVTPATTTVCSIDAPVMLTVAPSNPTPSPTACTEIGNGQYPASAYTPTTCNGTTVNSITTAGYAGEYSVVNTSSNTIYTFGSSLAGDYVAIMDSTGTTVLAYGPSPLTWYNASETSVRFATENATCTTDSTSRTRSVICKPVDSVVFTPSTGLYTNAAGTVAYTGTAVTSVYAKPASTTTYTATATNANGCIRTATATINVTPATTWYADADGDGYGSPTAPTTLACSQPVGFASNSTDCDDTVATTHPGAVDVCYDGIDNDCNGNIDNVGMPGGCTPIVSVVQESQCGTTLANIDDYVYANIVSGAQGYRFRVTRMSGGLPTTEVQTIDRVLRVFRLTQLPLYAFNTTYQVEVSIRKNNVWQPYYGSACTVTTPASTTSIQSSQCGSTLTAMNDIIYADIVPFVTGYRFKVTNVLTSQVQIVDRATRDFRMSVLPIAAEFNSVYSIEVAVRNTDGVTYLPYGSSCNITTPSFPTTQVQTSQCTATASSNTEQIYADSYTGATTYRFRLINATLATPYSYFVDRPLRWFSLSMFPGLLPATTYTVQISIEINGVFGPYGKSCTITTPGAAREVSVKVTDEFKAVAYPNPFANNFKLNVNTSSEDAMEVRVYDMIGKLVEDRQVKASDIETLTVGDNYPTGVYNVIVSQGENTQTLRVIKR